MENCPLGANGTFTVTEWEPLCLKPREMWWGFPPEMMGEIKQAASTQDYPHLPLKTMGGRAAKSRVCSVPVPTLVCLLSLLPVTAAALPPQILTATSSAVQHICV